MKQNIEQETTDKPVKLNIISISNNNNSADNDIQKTSRQGDRGGQHRDRGDAGQHEYVYIYIYIYTCMYANTITTNTNIQ